MSTRALLTFAAATIAIAFGVALLVTGCGLLGGAEHPDRARARAAVVVTAHAVIELGDTCARHALAHEDLELARKCQVAYDGARLSLIATASGVDAWERSQTTRESVTCAVRHALHELAPAVRELEARGVAPPIIADAAALVATLGPCVEVQP